jgi:short-subunit dehydrogenase
MNASSKIWLVTGISTGFGRCLVDAILAAGNTVYGTMRKQDQVDAFNQEFEGKAAHALRKAALAHILKEQGRLDVLVNNAGYGFFGAIEEASEQDVRNQMETNFFSALALTQEVLPTMRDQRSGHIVQISSVAGFTALAGLGIYNASKFALEGFSEALAQEVAPLGIKVTLVEPGPFRTAWAGASSFNAATRIADYESTAHKIIDMIHGYSGNQPGDPAKGAKLIVEMVHSGNPPLRLPLGQQAIDRIRTKINHVKQEIVTWEEASLATAHDDVKA